MNVEILCLRHIYIDILICSRHFEASWTQCLSLWSLTNCLDTFSDDLYSNYDIYWQAHYLLWRCNKIEKKVNIKLTLFVATTIHDDLYKIVRDPSTDTFWLLQSMTRKILLMIVKSIIVVLLLSSQLMSCVSMSRIIIPPISSASRLELRHRKGQFGDLCDWISVSGLVKAKHENPEDLLHFRTPDQESRRYFCLPIIIHDTPKISVCPTIEDRYSNLAKRQQRIISLNVPVFHHTWLDLFNRQILKLKSIFTRTPTPTRTRTRIRPQLELEFELGSDFELELEPNSRTRELECEV